ncbi:fibroleukin-like [Saccostrea echinata]|uniref:fibroleukin-like n=1 Tax=Saccostrea echinata TaxID=191078 RepID=UPI002A815069|nr:fibroleukin-like [Saccostrea echinata]
MSFDNKKSDKELSLEHKAQSLTGCSVMCQKDCAFFGFHPILMMCRVHQKITSDSEMSDEPGWKYYFNSIPLDCKDLFKDGHTDSGVYNIYPYGTMTSPVRVYCHMETMDGGWTAIQKRIDGSLSFERNWIDYKNGFGTPEQEVWIGNDIIHQLTKGGYSTLYVSITLANGSRLYELYDRFSVSNETEKYQLLLEGPATGTLGDSMINTEYPNNAMPRMYFSTADRDYDKTGGNCALSWGGGWWFNACSDAFLNGPWAPERWRNPWYPTVSYGGIVGKTLMMIKRH